MKITTPSLSRAVEAYELSEAAKECARMATASTLAAGSDTQFLDAFHDYVAQVIRRYEAHTSDDSSDENRVLASAAERNASPLVLTLDWGSAAVDDSKRRRDRAERNAEALGLRSTGAKPVPKVTDDPVIAAFVSRLEDNTVDSLMETREQRVIRQRKELMTSMAAAWTEFFELGKSARDLGRKPPLVIEWARLDFGSIREPGDLDNQIARMATESLRAALAGSREGETLLKKRAAVFSHVAAKLISIPDESQYDAGLASRLTMEASEKLGILEELLVIEWVTAEVVRGESEDVLPIQYTTIDTE